MIFLISEEMVWRKEQGGCQWDTYLRPCKDASSRKQRQLVVSMCCVSLPCSTPQGLEDRQPEGIKYLELLFKGWENSVTL